MTGRELIIYILSNGLEDKPVYDGGRFIGYISEGEVAESLNVGVATIRAWINQGLMDCIVVGGMVYIPANFKSPLSNIS
jgi:hypothetical protein